VENGIEESILHTFENDRTLAVEVWNSANAARILPLLIYILKTLKRKIVKKNYYQNSFCIRIIVRHIL
jgi:hypothetical protein